MRSKATGAVPADIPARLESLRRRFERWRMTRQGNSRIPAALWTAAVKLAEAYGVCPTARILGLDYNSLKRRMASASPGDSPGSRKVGSRTFGVKAASQKRAAEETELTFVELAPPARGGPAECLVELEHPGGAKMRIQLKGAAIPDLAALSRSLWSAES